MQERRGEHADRQVDDRSPAVGHERLLRGGILAAEGDEPAQGLRERVGRIEGESTLWVTKDTRLPVRLQTTATPSTGGTVRIEAYIRDRNEPVEVLPPAVG